MHQEDDEQDDAMFIIFTIQENIREDIWFIDSGCSSHMTGNRRLFITLEDSVKKKHVPETIKC